MSSPFKKFFQKIFAPSCEGANSIFYRLHFLRGGDADQPQGQGDHPANTVRQQQPRQQQLILCALDTAGGIEAVEAGGQLRDVLVDAAGVVIPGRQADLLGQGRQLLDELFFRLMLQQGHIRRFGHRVALRRQGGDQGADAGVGVLNVVDRVFAVEEYKLCTGKETVELLEFLDANKEELDDKEKRIVYLLLKDIRNMAKIPMDEYVAYEELLVEADDVWHTAKETSDFALFEPILQKIFDTNLRFAGYIDPEKDPYDLWLNEYEEGLNKEFCDKFFNTLKERLVPLIKKVGEMPQVDTSCLKGYFLASDQEKLAHWLMRTMAMDLDHIGLATTEHPFTTSFGSHNDVRITTHYYEENVSFSMYSVIHEGGHALYDSGSADEFAYTALDGGISMGIHESQSRFYENILGRSRAFCNCVLPVMKALFPQMGATTVVGCGLLCLAIIVEDM